jgi:hypothetical protein
MFESFTTVTMKTEEVCKIKSKSVRELHITLLRSVRRLLVSANFVPSSRIFVTLMMEALCSSEMSVLTRVTRLNIEEDGILQVLL